MNLDNDVVFESILDVAGSKSEDEIMIDLILLTMYVRFGGRQSGRGWITNQRQTNIVHWRSFSVRQLRNVRERRARLRRDNDLRA